MNCFIHDRSAAVGLCAACQKAVCRECVGRDTPRLLCRTCIQQRAVLGFEYRSRTSLGGWPLIHICLGVDPATMRPRVAKGIVAIGNVAVGGVAIAGLACGLVTVGGASFGLLFARDARSTERSAMPQAMKRPTPMGGRKSPIPTAATMTIA